MRYENVESYLCEKGFTNIEQKDYEHIDEFGSKCSTTIGKKKITKQDYECDLCVKVSFTRVPHLCKGREGEEEDIVYRVEAYMLCTNEFWKAVKHWRTYTENEFSEKVIDNYIQELEDYANSKEFDKFLESKRWEQPYYFG